jgi:hypothetical protein
LVSSSLISGSLGPHEWQTYPLVSVGVALCPHRGQVGESKCSSAALTLIVFPAICTPSPCASRFVVEHKRGRKRKPADLRQFLSVLLGRSASCTLNVIAKEAAPIRLIVLEVVSDGVGAAVLLQAVQPRIYEFAED